MSALADLRDLVELDLRDSGNEIWSTGDIDRAIKRALVDYSAVRPQQAEGTITLSADGREVSLSTLTGLIRVVRAWYPYTAADPEDPPSWVRWELWGTTLYVLSGDEPADTEVVRVYYHKLHTIEDLESETTTTIPVDDEEVVVLGAGAYAALQEGRAAVAAAGVSTETPEHWLRWGLTSLDRIQLAFERLMGLDLPDEHSDIARLSGIREMYLMMTGDHDFYGKFYPERVRLSNVTTASMTSVVKNVLNKILLQAYNVRPRWWKPIAYEEDFGTLNQITWMKSGGIGNLPTVAEGAAYTELDWSDAEETGTFLKKGGYIGITLEMMDRDNVGAVKRIPREIGNAAWRTLSALVSALFTDASGAGPTMGCTHAVFDASNHGNLLTTALSAAAWDAVIQAVYQQTEPGSSAPLAIRPKFCLVPIELERTALTIFEQPWSAEATYHYLEPRAGSSAVVTVPEWTDPNNWAAVVDPQDCPGICIGYRYGREPELFLADDQVVGSMFTNDEMRIKCRFFVAVGVADYRPLHKSNVA